MEFRDKLLSEREYPGLVNHSEQASTFAVEKPKAMMLEKLKSGDKVGSRPFNAAAQSSQIIYQDIVDYIRTINEERRKAKNSNKTEFENRLVMRRRCIEMRDHYKQLEVNVLMGGDDTLFINE